MTQVPPTRNSSAIMTLAPCPAAMRPARTPAEPAPMMKRSTSKAGIGASQEFAGGTQPHDGSGDRRRPPRLPCSMPDKRHGGHRRQQGEAHRRHFAREPRDPPQQQHDDDDRESRAGGAELDP